MWLRRRVTSALVRSSNSSSLSLLSTVRWCSSGDTRWKCSCGFSNFSFRGACFHCNASNPTPPATNPLQFDSTIQTDGAMKFSGIPMVGQPRKAAFRTGDWSCHCGAHNFAKRSQCFVCGAPKSGEATGVRLLPGDWICSSCNGHNFRSKTECYNCSSPKPESREGVVSSRPEPADTPSQLWTCQSCHSINEQHTTTCHVCTAERISTPVPAAEMAAEVQQSKKQFQDWLCAGCSFTNFEKRTHCRSCGAPKPQTAGILGAAGAPPASSAAQWLCGCGFSNFAYRHSCKKCNTERPSSTSAEKHTMPTDPLDCHDA